MQTTMNRQIRFKCVKKYKMDKCALMEIIVRLHNQECSCSIAPPITENGISKSAVKLERKKTRKDWFGMPKFPENLLVTGS